MSESLFSIYFTYAKAVQIHTDLVKHCIRLKGIILHSKTLHCYAVLHFKTLGWNIQVISSPLTKISSSQERRQLHAYLSSSSCWWGANPTKMWTLWINTQFLIRIILFQSRNWHSGHIFLPSLDKMILMTLSSHPWYPASWGWVFSQQLCDLSQRCCHEERVRDSTEDNHSI